MIELRWKEKEEIEYISQTGFDDIHEVPVVRTHDVLEYRTTKGLTGHGWSDWQEVPKAGIDS